MDSDRGLLGAVPAAVEAWAGQMGFSLKRRIETTAVKGPGFHCGFRLLELDMAVRLVDLPSSEGVSGEPRRRRARFPAPDEPAGAQHDLPGPIGASGFVQAVGIRGQCR